jgi:hypothetical protein
VIIADGDTPSAQMAAGELKGAFGSVEMRPATTLFGAELAGARCSSCACAIPSSRGCRRTSPRGASRTRT